MSITIRSYYFPQEHFSNGWQIMLSLPDGHIGTTNGKTSLIGTVNPDWRTILDRLRMSGIIKCRYSESFLELAKMGFVYPSLDSFVNPTQKEENIIQTFSEMPSHEFYGRSNSSALERFFGGNQRTAREAINQIASQVDRLPNAYQLLMNKLRRKGLV